LSTPAWIGFGAGAAAALAAAELVGALAIGARVHMPGAARAIRRLVDVVVRLGREGREPGAAERRRLLLLAAAGALVAGTTLAGPLAGLALAGAGPWLAARALRVRRERYRRAVDDGATGIAIALADALGGGHSLRGALVEAAPSVPGAAGAELGKVAAELTAGAPTDRALEAMRRRVQAHRIETVVAACLLQRRAGGDLAGLLRDCASAFEDQSRLQEEVRGATAQARFTGLVVVVLPLGGALLAELASPGFLAGLWSSFLTAWLVGLALALQIVAALVIRRLGHVRW
jgi:tight adherence protein B